MRQSGLTRDEIRGLASMLPWAERDIEAAVLLAESANWPTERTVTFLEQLAEHFGVEVDDPAMAMRGALMRL